MKRAHVEVLTMNPAHPRSYYKSYASSEETFHESIMSAKVMNKKCEI